MKENPLVSIVIVGMNVERFLPACLGSVEGLDYPQDRVETIYVDNASSDGSVGYVGKNHPRVRVLRNARNLGFSGGNNVGLRAARGDYLVLLNADAELEGHWLSRMLSCFSDDQSVGIAGCKIYYSGTRTLQHAGGYYDADVRFGHYGIFEEDRGQYDARREVGYVMAAAMMISRKCLDAIGLFDPHYFIYCEEIDWAEAARRAGFKVVYVPDAVARHHEMSFMGGRTRRFYLLYLRNRYRFIIKYFGLRWFLKACAKDLSDRGGRATDVPWKASHLLAGCAWNLIHLPVTIRCRGRRFR